MSDFGGSSNLGRTGDLAEKIGVQIVNSFDAAGRAADAAASKAANFVKVLESVGRGGKTANIDKYITSLARSTELLSNAVSNFSWDEDNLSFAEELVKSFAGFKALGGDVAQISEEIGENIQELANIAKSKAPDVAAMFDIQTMKDAASFMDTLREKNIEAADSFEKMRAASLSGDSTQRIRELTQAVDELTVRLNNAREVQENLQRELEESRGKNYSDIMESNKRELADWLVANNLAKNPWKVEEDQRFRRYFEMITEQSMTAQEAIRSVFADMQELSGAFNSPIFENAGNIEKTAIATEKQAVAVGALTAQSDGVALVAQQLGELFKAGSEAQGDASGVSQSITSLVEALQKLGDIGDDKLKGMYGVLSSISSISNSELKGSTFKNLFEGLNKLGTISDKFEQLSALTRIDLRGFNDLSVKKASMENLANNLPIIASANIDGLQRLAGINWTNLQGLNEVKPGKTAMDNLKGLVESMGGSADLKNSIDSLGTTIAENMKNIKIPITPQNFTGIDEAAIFIAETISEAITNAMAGAGSKAGSESTFVHPVIESLRMMKKELEATGSMLKSMGSDDPFKLEQMEKYKWLTSQLDQKIKDATNGKDTNVSYINKEIASLTEVVAAHKKAEDERTKAAEQAKADAEKTAAAAEKAAEREAKAQEKALVNAEKQKVSGDIAAAKASVNKLLKEGYGKDNYDAEAVNRVREAYANLLDMIAQLSTADSERYKNAVPYLQEQAQKVKELADAESSAARARAEAAKVESSRVELLDQVNKFMSEGSDAAQQNKQQLEELAAALSKTGQSAEDIKRLKKTFEDLQKVEKGAAKEMNGFVKGFDSILSRFTAANLVVKGFDWLVKQAKEMVTAVKEVDAAMTELKKVTDLTAEGYSKFYNDAVKTAHEIGSSVSDTINASAD